MDVEVSASGFTKEMADTFDEAAEEFNIRGGPGNPKTDEPEEEPNEEIEDEEDEDNDSVEEGKEEESVEVTPSPPPVEDRLSPPLNETSTENEKQRDLATGLDRAVEASNTVSEKDEGSDGSEEDLEDLHNQNRTLRPFRNEESLAHTNLHRRKHLDSTSLSVTSTTSSMDPRLIKEKVKRQMKKKAAVQESRRIRKSGESAIITKKKREISQDIKQSVDSDWF